jgi:hypothetical protein
VLHQLQLLLLGPLHLRRRRRQEVRPRLQEVRRRADESEEEVQVRRHLPRHVRPQVLEEPSRDEDLQLASSISMSVCEYVACVLVRVLDVAREQ